VEYNFLIFLAWHYGVLLLYGQNLAMNHLIKSNTINITKLDKLLDFPSANEESVFKKVHIHVFHGPDLFSKFRFMSGEYDNLTIPYGDTSLVKFYAVNIALQSKRMQAFELYNIFKNVSRNKK
jgi:hypothetical protein